jgi:hypothetical protein
MKLIFSISIFQIILIITCYRAISQDTSLEWRKGDSIENQIFPFAHTSDSSTVENRINIFLQNKYLNQPESYRDQFFEYNDLRLKTPNCSGVSITYEHQFNTSPGLWVFTDINYFDLRSGDCIGVMNLIDQKQNTNFLELVNQRKNTFLANFRNTLPLKDSNLINLNEIIDYTLLDTIRIGDIQKNIDESKAMANRYELVIHSDYLSLMHYWEYDWGLGKVELPLIELQFTYEELQPYLNSYALELLFEKKRK